MQRDNHDHDEGSSSSSNAVDSSPQSVKRIAAAILGGSQRSTGGGSFSLRPNRQRRPSTASTGNASSPGGSSNWDILPQSSSEFSIHAMAKNLGSSELVSDDAEDNKRRRKEIQKALKRQNFTLNQLNFDELELYGRSEELSELTDAVEACFSSVGKTLRASSSWQNEDAGRKRSSNTAARVVSVTGRAGSGKTRLCLELQQRVQSQGGLFLFGKFDQQNRMEPFSGIASALAKLPDLVFALGDDESDELCRRIQDAVGEEQYLLTTLVKDLSRLFYSVDCKGVTGARTQRSVVASDLEDKYETRSKRFKYLLCQLLQQLERPVILLLDDVQWSDQPSLSLLSDLVTDSNLRGFLLVTTCRDEDVSPSHPYSKLLDDLQRQSRIPAQRIPIENLEQSAVHSIVSTALRSSEESTLRLSKIVHQKSNGNPMYVIQFLKNLYDDGILSYSLGLMHWTWDEATVQSRFVTDNVVDLTTSKLQRLGPHLQTALHIASCLGQTFDKQHLKILLQEPRVRGIFREAWPNGSEPPEECFEPDASHILDELVKETVLEFNPHFDSYSFLHDLIQEAAFQLIPEAIRGTLQIEVGKRLLQYHQSSALEDRYYLRAVELSNTGIDKLNKTERLALAHYNLIAGENAVSKAAFTSALRFFEAGLNCMGPEAWTVERWLALELSSGAVEASYCSANFESMEVHMASVLDRDIPISDKIRVYLTRILSYAALDRSEDALDTGRKVLQELGVTRLPKNPANHHVLLELLKTKAILRHHDESTLNALPPLDDKAMFQALSIIDMMQPAAYLYNLKLFAVMNLRSLRWTVKRGVCQFSPTLFATYGIILCGLGEQVSGSTMGSVAMSLSERLEARSSRSKTINCVYAYSAPWTISLRSCLKPMLHGYKLGMQTGEVEMALFNLSNYEHALLVTSATPLKPLLLRLMSAARLTEEYNHESVRVPILVTIHFVLSLMGDVEVGRPRLPLFVDASRESAEKDTNVLSESELSDLVHGSKSVGRIQFMEYTSLQLAYYFEEYGKADRFSRATSDFAKQLGGHFFTPRSTLFRGLTALAVARRSSGRARWTNLRHAAQLTRQLKRWADAGNLNCVHMLQLLEAETATLARRRSTKAKNLFLVAVNTASRNGYLNDKALCHERAMLFHLENSDRSQEDRFWAENHFKDSVQAYCEWNAYRKARHLVERYGDRFPNATTAISGMTLIPESLEFSERG